VYAPNWRRSVKVMKLPALIKENCGNDLENQASALLLGCSLKQNITDRYFLTHPELQLFVNHKGKLDCWSLARLQCDLVQSESAVLSADLSPLW